MKNYVLRKNFTTLALSFIGMLNGIESAWAVSPCTNSSLNGSYGYSEQGTTYIQVTSETIAIAIAEAGIITADGRGNFRAEAKAIWSPPALPPSVEQPLTLVFTTTGPGEGYTINPNCTGDAIFTTTVTDKNGFAVPVNPINGSNIIPNRSFHFVLSSEKNNFKFVSTTPGTVATGSGSK
jgi:hypothetical protein